MKRHTPKLKNYLLIYILFIILAISLIPQIALGENKSTAVSLPNAGSSLPEISEASSSIVGISEDVDWESFWRYFDVFTSWKLQYNIGKDWIDTEGLKVLKNYPSPDVCKITLEFTSKESGNYRIIFEIQRTFKKSISRVDRYQYELEYEGFTVIFDWSDISEPIKKKAFNAKAEEIKKWFSFIIEIPNLSSNYKVTIDPSVVGTSITTTATSLAAQRKQFYAEGRIWAAYSDGYNDNSIDPSLILKSSLDAINWVEANFTSGHLGDKSIRDSSGTHFSLAFDGTYFHIAKDMTKEEFFPTLAYARFKPNADGTVTRSTSSWQVIEEGDDTRYYLYPVIAIDANGYPWIGACYRAGYGESMRARVLKSSTKDGTWTTQFNYELEDLGWYYECVVIPVALSNGDVYVVWGRTESYVFRGKLWSDGTWEDTEYISDYSATDPFLFSAIEYPTNGVFFVYLWGSNGRYRIRTTTWSTEQSFDDAITARGVFLSKNFGGTFVQMTYYREGVIAYKRYDVTLSSRTTWVTTTLTDNSQINGFFANYGDIFGVLYTTGTTSPYDVNFAYLGYVETLFKINNMDAGRWLFAEEKYYDFMIQYPSFWNDTAEIKFYDGAERLIQYYHKITYVTSTTTSSATVIFNSTASDGYIVYEGAATYEEAWISGTGTYLSDTELEAYIGQDYSIETETYSIHRSFLFFDTSSIPENAIVTSAILSIYGASDDTVVDFDIVVQNGQPTYPHDPLVLGDYNQACYSGNGGSFNTENFIITGYNDITLNSDGKSWINKEDTTKLCLRSSRDISGLPPDGTGESIAFWTYEYSNLPKLTVTYSVTTTSTAPSFVQSAGIVSGAEYISMEVNKIKAEGITYGGLNYTRVTVPILIRTHIVDALNVDFYWRANKTTGETTGWLLIANDYANIYCRGGAESLTKSGSAGRTVGGDAWELYTGDNLTSWAKSEIIYHNLQHFKTQFSIYCPIRPTVGDSRSRVYLGMDYYLYGLGVTGEGSWVDGFYVKIEFDSIPPTWDSDMWLTFNCTAYNRGVQLGETEKIWFFYETQFGEADSRQTIRLWADIWINRLNASSVWAIRITPYYYAMAMRNFIWFPGYSSGDWVPQANYTRYFTKFGEFKDANNEKIYSKQIELQKIWCMVEMPDGGAGVNAITLKEFNIFDLTITTRTLEGIQTPPFEEIKTPDMPLSGFMGWVVSAILTLVKALIDIFGPALGALGTAVIAILDGIMYGLTGQPNVFSSFITFLIATIGGSITIATTLPTSFGHITTALVSTFTWFFENIFVPIWGIITFATSPAIGVFQMLADAISIGVAWMNGTAYTDRLGNVYNFTMLAGLSVLGFSGGKAIFAIIAIIYFPIVLVQCAATASLEPLLAPIRLFWGMMQFIIKLVDLMWSIVLYLWKLIVAIIHAIVGTAGEAVPG